jgi:hypothetical protein
MKLYEKVPSALAEAGKPHFGPFGVPQCGALLNLRMGFVRQPNLLLITGI